MTPAACAVGGGGRVARDGTCVVARVEVTKLFPSFSLGRRKVGEGRWATRGGSQRRGAVARLPRRRRRQRRAVWRLGRGACAGGACAVVNVCERDAI